ncbi:MAG: 2-C-methyl-D-erythritol 2,4-cyclodiphosphate synthase [Acidobacteriota bacterium]|jgi:2-C-methyl-D-erythritol 2,4-cyclodiphosphate synthase
MRIGHGWDQHRLADGRPFRLGGVVIPFSKGPVGHSDGDVLLHALTDALLGAAGLGDIGTYFSDRDPKWKDADSAGFLKAALGMVEKRGFRIENADITVVLEAPRIGPFRNEILDSLAALLRIEKDRINLKAKTAEGFDAVGAGDAVACHAVVLLVT